MKETGALFSADNVHRYALWRKWNLELPNAMFIGLNPSTANDYQNDNTITKIIKVARCNGYGGIYMLNLFSFITPYPEKLIIDDKEYKNYERLVEYAKKSKAIIFCWGNFKQAQGRANDVIRMFPEALCLKQNKNGSPKHPLYCKDNSILIPFVN